jgi:glycosyltransferase involved in cell wall biosynthesis
MNTKKKVLLRAPLLTISGYGVHSRQIFEYLDKREDIDLTVELLNWGQTSWMIDPDMLDGMIGRIMHRSKPVKAPFDLTYQVQLPDEWDPKLGHKNIGISAFVEADKCNPTWLDKCNLMDEIVVPSTFTKDLVEQNNLCRTTVSVIPEWFNSHLLRNNKSLVKDKLKLDTSFNFLLFGQLTGQNPWTDRKNIFFTIKWFCETFTGIDDVGLVIKTNVGKSTIIDRKLTRNTLESIIKEVRIGDYPKIHLVHGNMTPNEIAGIYQQPEIKCLITATRGEGYGLPIVDAAASGMPVIATGWSGHMDFLDKKYSTFLKYTLKNIHEGRIDNRIFVPDSKWAEVDELDFKKKILGFYQSSTSKTNGALKLRRKVINNFGIKKITKLYDKLFDRHLGE